MTELTPMRIDGDAVTADEESVGAIALRRP